MVFINGIKDLQRICDPHEIRAYDTSVCEFRKKWSSDIWYF